MTETKFTPGVWSVRDCPMKAAQTDPAEDGRIKLIDFNDGTYEGTLAIVQTEESEANAHLISAAPELYEALTNLVGLAKLGAARLDKYHAAMSDAEAALAKARGES